jgi:hypothetical protein
VRLIKVGNTPVSRELGDVGSRLFLRLGVFNQRAQTIDDSSHDFLVFVGSRQVALASFSMKLRTTVSLSVMLTLRRTMRRTRALCSEKGVCEKDLVRHPDDPVWKSYCSNAVTLETLALLKACPLQIPQYTVRRNIHVRL